MSRDQFAKMLPCRMRRRLARGLKRKHLNLISRLQKAKKAANALEKPATVKTHLRYMIIFLKWLVLSLVSTTERFSIRLRSSQR
ncbi:hypothetical protein GCK32_013630 [Trichostrongylus colubriformis]|uniref:40S ribosomal protein S15 n=1 Tax=Trichostrongylus colubriformis TaxID=6319 RepID=A0AAN8G2X9_TRICO